MLPVQIPWSLTATTITATALLSTIGSAYLLFGWLRKRSWRVLLRGIGFVLMPIGCYLLGGMNVAYRGVNAFFTWANATYLDSKLLTAIIITGVGLTAYVIGSCWPQVLGAEAKTRRTMLTERRETKKAGIGVISGATTPPNNPATLGLNGTLPLTPGTTPGWSSPTSSLEPSSATEDEIDAILRRHGIQ